MAQINIREANMGDLNQLLQLEQRLIKAERPFDPTIEKDPVTYYNLEAMLKDEGYYVLVAESENVIVSSGYATTKSARPYLDHSVYAYLGFMYTLQEFRGRGINQRIVKRLVAWAHAKGLKEIRLTVYEENLPAIRAYEKSGFYKHLIEMRIKGQV